MEGWLHGVTLPSPMVAVAGNKASPKNAPGARTLDFVVRMETLAEDLVDVIGMNDENERLWQEQTYHVVVLLLHSAQEGQRLLLKECHLREPGGVGWRGWQPQALLRRMGG
jgi:hypothetical protein